MAELRKNLEDVNHHGKRADGIVRNMLLHSRSGNSEKSPVDMHQLIRESVNLAYHGFRATNVNFKTSIDFEFGSSVFEVPAISHDIHRVLLNISSNAFYAIQKRWQNSLDQGKLKISTRNINDVLEICISDNAMGINKEFLEKIFEPFFTTKPTGEGTGLGLSMSHEIVTSGHQGSLRVQSRPNEGTTFIIDLPTKG